MQLTIHLRTHEPLSIIAIGAGYQSGFEELPLTQRITHPGNHGFPDATFDFLFARDLKASPQKNISIIVTTRYRGLKRATNWEVHPIAALWKCTKSRHAC